MVYRSVQRYTCIFRPASLLDVIEWTKFISHFLDSRYSFARRPKFFRGSGWWWKHARGCRRNQEIRKWIEGERRWIEEELRVKEEELKQKERKSEIKGKEKELKEKQEKSKWQSRELLTCLKGLSWEAKKKNLQREDIFLCEKSTFRDLKSILDEWCFGELMKSEAIYYIHIWLSCILQGSAMSMPYCVVKVWKMVTLKVGETDVKMN